METSGWCWKLHTAICSDLLPNLISLVLSPLMLGYTLFYTKEKSSLLYFYLFVYNLVLQQKTEIVLHGNVLGLALDSQSYLYLLFLLPHLWSSL